MWWHDAIIDQMLDSPHLTKRDIAVILGKTPQFIYRVTGSDLFQSRYAARRAEYEAALGVDLVAKVNRVAAKSLDLILEQLESKGTLRSRARAACRAASLVVELKRSRNSAVQVIREMWVGL
jgi:hypothetical protein